MENKNKNIGVSYQLFILALSVFAIINSAWYYLRAYSEAQQGVVWFTDIIISAFFILDFFIRFKLSSPKRGYVFKRFGWVDLLTGIPIPIFKFFRVISIWEINKTLKATGEKKLFRTFLKTKGNSAIFTILFLIINLLQTGSLLVLYFESKTQSPEITTAQEAIWWSFATITTVGYGDYTPVTLGGRVVGIVMMIVGIALFGVLTAFLAQVFATKDKSDSDKDDMLSEMKSLKEEIKNLKKN